jgi:hypothetical protein
MAALLSNSDIPYVSNQIEVLTVFARIAVRGAEELAIELAR